MPVPAVANNATTTTASVSTSDRSALLVQAAKGGDVSKVEALLRDDDVHIDWANERGMTALFAASQGGHAATVKVLLAGGAKLDLATITGATPLLIASEKGHRDIVQVLLKAGANKEQASNSGATPLSMAVQNGHTSTVGMLEARAAAVPGADRASSPSTVGVAAAPKKGHTAGTANSSTTDTATVKKNPAAVGRKRTAVMAMKSLITDTSPRSSTAAAIANACNNNTVAVKSETAAATATDSGDDDVKMETAPSAVPSPSSSPAVDTVKGERPPKKTAASLSAQLNHYPPHEPAPLPLKHKIPTPLKAPSQLPLKGAKKPLLLNSPVPSPRQPSSVAVAQSKSGAVLASPSASPQSRSSSSTGPSKTVTLAEPASPLSGGAAAQLKMSLLLKAKGASPTTSATCSVTSKGNPYAHAAGLNSTTGLSARHSVMPQNGSTNGGSAASPAVAGGFKSTGNAVTGGMAVGFGGGFNAGAGVGLVPSSPSSLKLKNGKSAPLKSAAGSIAKGTGFGVGGKPKLLSGARPMAGKQQHPLQQKMAGPVLSIPPPLPHLLRIAPPSTRAKILQMAEAGELDRVKEEWGLDVSEAAKWWYSLTDMEAKVPVDVKKMACNAEFAGIATAYDDAMVDLAYEWVWLKSREWEEIRAEENRRVYGEWSHHKQQQQLLQGSMRIQPSPMPSDKSDDVNMTGSGTGGESSSASTSTPLDLRPPTPVGQGVQALDLSRLSGSPTSSVGPGTPTPSSTTESKLAKSLRLELEDLQKVRANPKLWPNLIVGTLPVSSKNSDSDAHSGTSSGSTQSNATKAAVSRDIVMQV
jgi:hypothetical protein